MDSLQHFKKVISNWHAPVLGMGVGLAYGFIDRRLILQSLHAPGTILWLDEMVELSFPMVLGLLAGILVNHARRQARINHMLSTVNAKLQRNVLMQTLGSHILHEIRNPLHNIDAVLEGWEKKLPPEEAQTLQRNIHRLQAVIKQLSRWNALDDEMELRQEVPLAKWVEMFVRERVHQQLHQEGILLEQAIEPSKVWMHPLMLEQCFIALFDNSIKAVLHEKGPRTISLTARVSLHRPAFVEIQLRNSGASYPEEVLLKQGREPVESRQGLGLGLVLVQRTLEPIGGSIQLSNDAGQATTLLWIPGQKA